MATISSPSLQNYFALDPATHWQKVKIDNIQTKEQAATIANACVNDARMERLKAFTHFIMGAGIVLIAAPIACLAYNVSYLAITIFTFPLFLVPSLWGLVTLGGSLGVGLSVAVIIYKKYAAQFFESAQAEWKYANHLYQQELAVNIKKGALGG